MKLDRRHFLLSSAAASQAAFSQTEAARIPTAMIGTGNRGSFVLKGVLEQSNAKVAALCDLKPARLDAAATAAAKDNPTTYTEWKKDHRPQGHRGGIHRNPALPACRNGHRGHTGR